MNARERFAMKHDANPAGCWIWRGALSDTGYGSFRLDGHAIGAHRAAYTLHVGPIPSGYTVDHICRNRRCVRPEHLRLLTQADNARHRGPSHHNTSGHRGVTWNKNAKKWHARVRDGHTLVHIGYFSTLQDAADAAERERIARWGAEIGSEAKRVVS